MIFEAIKLMSEELKAYIAPLAEQTLVEIGSIANMVSTPNDTILLSLVNVEEETALRNMPPPFQHNAAGNLERKQPPVFLNLYVMVAANFSTDANYETALRRLGRVVQCFQRKTIYTVANTPNVFLPAEAATLKVTTELYSLTFEKLNQLWGTMGGKQIPSVVYKVRVVEEQAEMRLPEGPAVMTVEGQFTQFSPSS